MSKNGQLSVEQFLLAMHLVKQRKVRHLSLFTAYLSLACHHHPGMISFVSVVFTVLR